MDEMTYYGDAVSIIKRAILEAQGIAARNANEVQLKLKLSVIAIRQSQLPNCHRLNFNT